jgi:CRP-like cAMP-binding protein
MPDEDFFRTFLGKFVNISDNEYDNLFRPVIISRIFEKKELITAPGEVENYFNFIVKGVVRKYYLHGQEEINTQISLEGHLIHSQESFHSRTPSEYCVEAIEPTALLSITYNDLEKILTSSQKMEHMGRVIMTYVFILKDKWQMQLVKLNSKERFLQFITSNPEMLQRVPQKHLASYLNIQPETFSRFKHLVKGHISSK